MHILGCGSALPTPRHNPSSQIVDIRGKLFMLDCGEGTQSAARRTHLNWNNLRAILITHLHGDHVLGLIGLLSSFALQGRTAPLTIFAPAAYEPLFRAEMEMYCPQPGYDITFRAVDTTAAATIYDDRSLTISTVPLQHRMPCAGYLLREKPGLRHIRPDMTAFYHVPLCQMNLLRAGHDYVAPDGETVPNDRLTTPPDPVRGYAYISDTRYLPALADSLTGITTLYHESTYADEHQARAEKYQHSTAREAAKTARDAGVRQLLLGHYSQRYRDESVLLVEAQEVFPNTALTDEGLTFDI